MLLYLLYFMKELNKVTLATDEIEIDSWDLYYTFSDGNNFFGTITITNKRIFFETKTEGAFQAMLAASPIFTNHTPGYVILSKKRIKHIETEKSLFCKKAIITLDNGEKHILDRKMMAIDKIVEALKKK